MSYRHQILLANPEFSIADRKKLMVYVVEHSPRGALGVIINQKACPVTLNHLRSHLSADKIPENLDIDFGGPDLCGEHFFCLHKKSLGRFERTTQLGSDLYLTVCSNLKEKLSSFDQINLKVFYGMIRWAPWELEAQILQDRWFNKPYQEDFVFNKDNELGEVLWEKAFEQLGISWPDLYLESHEVH